MQPYQARVVEEKATLDEKRGKLRDFVGAQVYGTLPMDERTRLVRQLEAMDRYADILHERILAFPPEATTE